MKKLIIISIISIFSIQCEKGWLNAILDPILEGCNIPTACNYNPNVNKFDNSCEYTSCIELPVSLSIKNVHTDAGTLDIYMTNTAGCSYCDDPLYNTQTLCEYMGNNTAGGTWTFDDTIDEATCATMNGDYFNGGVAGFQFYIKGVTITGVSGGTAGQMLDFINFNASTGKVMGVSFDGGFIPESSGVLTTITFSNAEDEICFAKDIPNVTEMVIGSIDAQDIDANWGGCVIP